MTERTPDQCRADFPSLERQHRGQPIAYLDGPAGSQVPEPVIEAVSAVYRHSNGNTHGCFPVSRDVDDLVAHARATVATFLGADSGATVSFGPSMTGLNFSLSRALGRQWGPGDEVVITAADHEGNRAPWLRLAEERGVTVREVALAPDGTLDLEDLEEKLTERTRLLAMTAASNALGIVPDLARARRLTAAVGAYLLVDAVHYAPHFAIDVAGWDVDFLLCSAYKFYGPHVGILYCRPGLLDQLDTDRLRTQGQTGPERIQLGTQNFAAISGVRAAVEYIASFGVGADLRSKLLSAFERIGEHERRVATSYVDRVAAISGVKVWGPAFETPRAPTIAISHPARSAAELAAHCGQQGIQVWDGHFYAIRTTESLGLEGQGGLLRAGFLVYNTVSEAERLATAVGEALRA